MLKKVHLVLLIISFFIVSLSMSQEVLAVKYYYSKYNSNASSTTGYNLGSHSYYGNERIFWFNGLVKVYRNVSVDSATGTVSYSGEELINFDGGVTEASKSTGKYYIASPTRIIEIMSYYGRDNESRQEMMYVNNLGAVLETTTSYTRGSLIQSNIIAENGSYPVNGRHTDGYWYVRGTLANNAPTTPQSFVIGGPFIPGGTIPISWGTSTDPDGDGVTYGLEVSINGGTFTQIFWMPTQNHSYILPTNAKSVTFRVRAYDGWLYSNYNTSSTYTVNTPPTTPTLTVPSVEFETRSQHILSWNGSDADGDTLTYTLEASYNNGTSWTSLYSGANKTYAYTVSTNQTQVSFRVRAFDGTAYSPYATSANKTIKEVLYKWSKFASYAEYDFVNAPWVEVGSLVTPATNVDHSGYLQLSIADGKFVTSSYTSTWRPRDTSPVLYNMPYDNGNRVRGLFPIGYSYMQKEVTVSQVSSRYVKGTLVDNNIVAGYDAYLHDKRNTDGFWYVRGSIANSAPTTPTLTVPSVDFVSGSQQILNWNSTDVDGDALTYTLEASYNNGTSWTTLYSGANKTYTYTVPTNQTQVSFRVRAYDGTAYSSYSTSANITIKEILYNWSKYNNKIETSQTINWEGVPTDQSSLSTGGMYYYSINDLYSSVSVQGGKIVGSGKVHTYGQEFTRTSGTFYNVYPNGDLTYRIIILGNDGMWLRYSTQMGRPGVATSTNVRGTLVTNNIQAGYNAYVHNQRNSDGYWYVRGGLAESPPETPTLTVPTVQFEHGDIHLITWNSSNADSVTYTLEASYNNGSTWSSLYNGTNKNYTYTVPSNQTQVLFRVKASNGSNDSAYATSVNKTIREVMYYWSKYNALNNGYTVGSTSVSYRTYTTNSNYSLQGRLAQPFLDYMPDTGRPYYNQIGSVINLELYDVGRTIYSLSTSSSETTYTKSTITSYDGAIGYAGIYEEFYRTPILIAYKPGSLIQGDVQAGYNAYIHNARNPDGFWWVRGQRVLAGDITPPIIELTEQAEMGRTSTVTVNTFDVSTVTVTKWAVGNQPISYFASGGTNVTNNKFSALTNGVYTVYAKDAKGNEGVETITVTKVDPFTVYTYDDANALISTSIGHSLLISSDQHVYAFGSNDVGQLGLGDTTDRPVPTKIESINNAVAVSAGQQSLVLTEDGDVYAFGYNASGQLGLGDSNNRNVPVKIPGISNAIAIDASETHSMILTEDGSVYTFGDNSFGQLGVKGVSERNVPTKVTGISNAVGISAGSYHSLVVTEDGAVYGFGFNYNGQLGLGNTTQQDTATKIPNISNAIGVSAGEMHSLVLTENGEVYAFGSNASGELGLGDTADRFVPTKITSLNDVAAISASSEFSLFVTKNGEAYSTDLNGKDPIEPNVGKIPVKIATIENAVAINGGYAQLFIITEDQNVYSFGSNTYGQLGHGNTTNRLVPTKITAVQSAVIDLDRMNPTGYLTVDSTDWTNGNVDIVASGFDTGGSGFQTIQTPDGTFVKNSSTTYTVTENGTYTFVFKDRARNFVEKSVTVTHIDKTAPSITFTPEFRKADFKDIEVQITIANVGASGLKHMRYAWSTEESKPTDGWSAWETTPNLSLTQAQGGKWYLHIEAVDNTGNVAYVTGGSYEKIVVSGGPSVTINVFPLPTGQWVNQPIDVYIMDSGDAELLSKAKKYYEVTNSPLYPSQFSTVVPTDKKVQLNLQGENFIHIHYILDDGTKISSTSGPYLIDTGSVGTFEMKLVDSSGNEVSDWTNEPLQLVMSNPSASSVSGINKQYRIEGLHTDWQPYVEGTTITVEGAYRIFGRIVSGTGTSSAQQVLNAKIDQTKPTTSSLKLVKNTNNTYDVRLKAADALSGVKEVVLNNGTKLTPNNNEYVISGLTAKPTSVSITDVAGNNSSSVAFATEPTIVFDAPYTLTTPLYRNDVVANLTNATGYLIGNRGFACTGEPCKVTLSQSGIFTAVRTDGVKETRVAIKIDNIDQSHLHLVLSGKRNSLSPKEITFTWNYALTTGTLLCYEDGQSKLYAVSGKSFGLNGKNYLYSCSVSGDYKGVNLSSNTITVYPDSSLPSEGTGGVPGSDVTTNIYFQETMLGKSYLINAKTNNYTDNYVPIPENEITAN